MPTKRLLPILVLMLVALLTSAAYAQVSPPPRAAPPNDNFAGAMPIIIGENYKVKHIELATNEAGEPGVGCYSNFLLPQSVWFTFSTGDAAQVYLSTEGTELYSPNYDIFATVMVVYTGSSINALTPVICSNGPGSTQVSIVNFLATGGTTYHVLVGTNGSADYEPPSFFKLNTRTVAAFPATINGSFELPLGTDNWKLKHPSGDEILCNSLTYPTSSGNCAFKFTGNPGESSKLSQTDPFPSGMIPRKNGVIQLIGQFRIFDTASLGNAKISLTVRYSDGTPSTKRSLSLKGLVPTSEDQGVSMFAYLASGNVDGFEVKVSFKSTSGVLLVDGFTFRYNAAPSTRLAGPLRPPASAN